MIHFADGGHLSGENTDVFLMDPVQEDILVIPLLPEEDSHAVEVVGAVEIVEQHVVEIQPASPGNEAANADIEDPYGKPRKKKLLVGKETKSNLQEIQELPTSVPRENKLKNAR